MFVPDRVRQSAAEFRSNTENRTLDHLLADRSPARRKAIIAALEELLEVLREQTPDEPPRTNDTAHRAIELDNEPAAAIHGRAARAPRRGRR